MIWPELLGLERTPTTVGIAICLPLLLLVAGLNILGFFSLCGWVMGYCWFPFKSLFYLLGTTKKAYKWYHKISSKVLLLLTTVMVCIFGLLATDPLFLKAVSFLAMMSLFVVVFRISEKAFDPLGSVGRTIEGFIALKENTFFQMIVGFFTKKKDSTKADETATNLERVVKILGYTFKVPELIQNPKLPLGLFLFNLIPIVTFTMLLFAVIYKSILTSDPSLSLNNSDYLRMSLYQFTGSDFHALPEMPKNISWWLGFESLVAYYYSVILILAFGLTAQTQSSALSKKLHENLSSKVLEAAKLLPAKLAETHSKEEADVITKTISQHAELNANAVRIDLNASMTPPKNPTESVPSPPG